MFPVITDRPHSSDRKFSGRSINVRDTRQRTETQREDGVDVIRKSEEVSFDMDLNRRGPS